MTHEFSFTADVKGDFSALMEEVYKGEVSVYREMPDGTQVEICRISRAPGCPIEIYKAFLDSLV